MTTCAVCGQPGTAYRVRWDENNRTVHLCHVHAKPITDLVDAYSGVRDLRRFDDYVATIEEIEELERLERAAADEPG